MKRISRGLAKMDKLKKPVLLAVLIFVVAAAVIGAIYLARADILEREAARKRELAAPYELERTRLERELSGFDSRLAEPIPGGATLTTMIIGADRAVYTNILPIFAEVNETMKKDASLRGEGGAEPPEGGAAEQSDGGESNIPPLVATVAIHPGRMPGEAGMMSLAQMGELLEAGWTTAVYVRDEDAARLDGYLAEMKAAYAELGLEWCDTVCFEKFTYDSELYDATLSAHGIECVVSTVDEGESILSRDLEADVWCVRADGWSLSKANGSALDNYNTLISSVGAMTFLVEVWGGSNREGPTHLRPYTDDASFARMLSILSESVVSGDMIVDSASSAEARYAAYHEEYTVRKETYEPMRAEVVARLAEVEAKLREIYGEGADE